MEKKEVNMSLKEKIQTDLKKAMQGKDQLRISVLRMLLAAIINKEKEKRDQLTDEETSGVISSEVKKRKDSIGQYEKGNRQDLAEQEKKELDVLMKYLPEQMSEEEIRKIVRGKIDELGISGPQETGKLMGAVMPQLKGKTEGGTVSKIVQEELKVR